LLPAYGLAILSEADPLGLFSCLVACAVCHGMTKVAILIDGGYFLKRLPDVRPDVDSKDPKAVADAIEQLVRRHLEYFNKVHNASNIFQLLYRSFYYDARPYDQKTHLPVSKKPFDYAESPQAKFRKELFDQLRSRPYFAVRLGEVRKHAPSWILKVRKQKQILKGEIKIDDLTDEDFSLALRQKGVDMRIGLDIASITLKCQANVIVLVSGDADFVPAAKLARREGMQFVLDPLWHEVHADLNEHIDHLRSGFRPPKKTTRLQNQET